jgi:hypothetical protein
MMREMVLIHVGLSCVAVVLASLLGTVDQTQALAVGALIAGCHLSLTIWCWQRVLNKKSIALTGAIIVSKYAILGALIYKILTGRLLNSSWFLIGFGIVVMTVVLTGFSRPKEIEA